MIRFGITMRITEAVNYVEPRDSIASDWSKYMLSAFPDAQFVFIPNIEEAVQQYIKDLKINVLIISGGDNLGTYQRRDKTETLALAYALENKIPVIGICRGLQLIHQYYGGQLIKGDADFIEQHRATKHEVCFKEDTHEVNSYHNYQIDEQSLADKFEVIARCSADNTIEAIQNNGVLAMMWHPERDTEIPQWNKKLIENFINK